MLALRRYLSLVAGNPVNDGNRQSGDPLAQNYLIQPENRKEKGSQSA